MNIKVNVEVKFESGAVINLTDTQRGQVSKYVEEVVFGRQEVVTEKRAYKKRGAKRAWTAEETIAVREIAFMPKGREKNKATKKLALEIKRTRAAISQKGVEIRAEYKAHQTYRPLDTITSYLGK